MLAAVAVFGAATIVFGLSRSMALSLALPRPARRRRHVLGLCPPVADPALHARRDARPGRRRLDPVHLRLERARRGGKRLPRRPDRPGRPRSSPAASAAIGSHPAYGRSWFPELRQARAPSTGRRAGCWSRRHERLSLGARPVQATSAHRVPRVTGVTRCSARDGKRWAPPRSSVRGRPTSIGHDLQIAAVMIGRAPKARPRPRSAAARLRRSRRRYATSGNGRPRRSAGSGSARRSARPEARIPPRRSANKASSLANSQGASPRATRLDRTSRSAVSTRRSRHRRKAAPLRSARDRRAR